MRNLIIALFLMTSIVFGQEKVSLTNQVVQLEANSSKAFYFAFTKNDQLVFTLADLKSKDGIEVSVREYGNEVLWSKNIRKADQFTTNVNKEAIYHFVLHNKSDKEVSVKVKIERSFSSNAGKKFNPNIKWVDRFDTTYTIENRLVKVYDTNYVNVREKEWKYTQREELIVEKNQTVSSTYTIGKDNKATVSVKLPDNFKDSSQSKRVVSWAYWVGVGEEANEQWKSNVKLIGTITKTVAGFYTSPLGALLLGQVTELAIPKSGEDVIYKVMDQSNYKSFNAAGNYKTIDKGQGTAIFKQLLEPKYQSGTFFFHLENDNKLQDILVNIKVVAIIETGTPKWVETKKMVLTPRDEKRVIKIPNVTVTRVPVIQK